MDSRKDKKLLDEIDSILNDKDQLEIYSFDEIETRIKIYLQHSRRQLNNARQNKDATMFKKLSKYISIYESALLSMSTGDRVIPFSVNDIPNPMKINIKIEKEELKEKNNLIVPLSVIEERYQKYKNAVLHFNSNHNVKLARQYLSSAKKLKTALDFAKQGGTINNYDIPADIVDYKKVKIDKKKTIVMYKKSNKQQNKNSQKNTISSNKKQAQKYVKQIENRLDSIENFKRKNLKNDRKNPDFDQNSQNFVQKNSENDKNPLKNQKFEENCQKINQNDEIKEKIIEEKTQNLIKKAEKEQNIDNENYINDEKINKNLIKPKINVENEENRENVQEKSEKLKKDLNYPKLSRENENDSKNKKLLKKLKTKRIEKNIEKEKTEIVSKIDEKNYKIDDKIDLIEENKTNSTKNTKKTKKTKKIDNKENDEISDTILNEKNGGKNVKNDNNINVENVDDLKLEIFRKEVQKRCDIYLNRASKSKKEGDIEASKKFLTVAIEMEEILKTDPLIIQELPPIYLYNEEERNTENIFKKTKILFNKINSQAELMEKKSHVFKIMKEPNLFKLYSIYHADSLKSAKILGQNIKEGTLPNYSMKKIKIKEELRLVEIPFNHIQFKIESINNVKKPLLKKKASFYIKYKLMISNDKDQIGKTEDFKIDSKGSISDLNHSIFFEVNRSKGIGSKIKTAKIKFTLFSKYIFKNEKVGSGELNIGHLYSDVEISSFVNILDKKGTHSGTLKAILRVNIPYGKLKFHEVDYKYLVIKEEKNRKFKSISPEKSAKKSKENIEKSFEKTTKNLSRISTKNFENLTEISIEKISKNSKSNNSSKKSKKDRKIEKLPKKIEEKSEKKTEKNTEKFEKNNKKDQKKKLSKKSEKKTEKVEKGENFDKFDKEKIEKTKLKKQKSKTINIPEEVGSKMVENPLELSYYISNDALESIISKNKQKIESIVRSGNRPPKNLQKETQDAIVILAALVERVQNEEISFEGYLNSIKKSINRLNKLKDYLRKTGDPQKVLGEVESRLAVMTNEFIEAENGVE